MRDAGLRRRRAIAGLLVPLAAAFMIGAPSIGSAALAGKYSGALYSDSGKVVKNTKVTFKVAGNKIRDFRARGGTTMCTTITLYGGVSFSFYPLAFAVPSVKITQNKFNGRYTVTKAGEKLAVNKLKGRFAGKRVSGTLEQSGPEACGAKYLWRAHLAR